MSSQLDTPLRTPLGVLKNRATGLASPTRLHALTAKQRSARKLKYQMLAAQSATPSPRSPSPTRPAAPTMSVPDGKENLTCWGQERDWDYEDARREAIQAQREAMAQRRQRRLALLREQWAREDRQAARVRRSIARMEELMREARYERYNLRVDLFLERGYGLGAAMARAQREQREDEDGLGGRLDDRDEDGDEDEDKDGDGDEDEPDDLEMVDVCMDASVDVANSSQAALAVGTKDGI